MAVTRLMVRENSNIKTIYDLKDKTAVTIWGSNMEKTFDQMNTKLTLRASNLIANDLDGALSVMETNAADAFIMDDVLLKLMQAASKNKTKYVHHQGRPRHPAPCRSCCARTIRISRNWWMER